MHLHTQCQGEGPPLVLLHGLFGSADNWGSIARHFSQDHQVISVDLRNHGRSPHADTQTYADMAEDVRETLDAMGIEQASVLGHSLGGKVAMQFASQYPSRVHKLIVVDMAMRAYTDAHTHLIAAMQAVDVRHMASRSAVDKALAAAIPDGLVRQFLLTNLVKVNDHLQWRLNLTGILDNYSCLQSAIEVNFQGPCLFIRGERSDYMSPADMAQIAQHFSLVKFASLPTDHWVHAEQPQHFIQVLEDFLRESH